MINKLITIMVNIGYMSPSRAKTYVAEIMKSFLRIDLKNCAVVCVPFRSSNRTDCTKVTVFDLTNPTLIVFQINVAGMSSKKADQYLENIKRECKFPERSTCHVVWIPVQNDPDKVEAFSI